MPTPTSTLTPHMGAVSAELVDHGETDVLTAYLDAQATFLAEARTVVLDPVTAAAFGRLRQWEPLTRLIDWPRRSRWAQLLRYHLLPVLQRWYRTVTESLTGETPPDGPDGPWLTVRQEYDDAFERDSWSDHLFAAVWDELRDSTEHGDPVELVQARMRRLLSLDAPTARIRNMFVRRARDDRAYVPELGDDDYTHRNAARTRSRWAAAGVANRATWDTAHRDATATGDQLFTVWLCKHDGRTRRTHLAADKQSVPLGFLFTVGGAQLRFPGDPFGPPAETANCRCLIARVDRADHERFSREHDEMNTASDAVDDSVVAAAEQPRMMRWRGMLAPLDTRADHRVIGLPEDGAVRTNQQMWLSHQEESAPGHDRKRRIGRIDRVWIDNGQLWGEGVFNPRKALAHDVAADIAAGFDGTISVDLADATGEERFYDADGYEIENTDLDPESFAAKHPDARVLTYYPSWRLAGATLVQDPAFHTGWIEVLSTTETHPPHTVVEPELSVTTESGDPHTPPNESVTSENTAPGGSEPEGDAGRVTSYPVSTPVLAASGATWADRVAALAADNTEPDPRVFTDPHLSGPTKVTVTDAGRVYGHVACWNTDHISFPGKGIRPPYSETGYSLFHRHPVRCSDGSRVRTGVLVMGTGHADLAASTSAASAHYDNTGHIVADVRAGEDAYGVWVAGALHPGVTPLQVTVLDRYSLSGDWRGGELVAALCVNTPGFPIPDSLAASGELPLTAPHPQCRTGEDGEPYALVAAGIVQPNLEQVTTSTSLDVVAEIRALREELAAERHEREAVVAARQEQETRDRIMSRLRRVHEPRLQRIEVFAAAAGKPKPNPTDPKKKQPTSGSKPAGQKTGGKPAEGGAPVPGQTPAAPQTNDGEAASEAAKKTTPKGDEAPDPKELGDAYKKEKDAQEEANTPGLLEDDPSQAEEQQLPDQGLLEDGDTGPSPEDFELMLDLLDELDDEDIALIELVTGLPVHERIAELEQQAENPDGENPPNLTEEVAQRQVENESADPVKQAKSTIEQDAAEAGLEGDKPKPSGEGSGKKKRSPSRPTVTAAKTPNWVSKHGGLPAKVKRTAQHLKRKGFSESHAIATAINVAKKACRTSDTNWPGKQKMNGKSKAEYCADVAQWEAMKTAAKGD